MPLLTPSINHAPPARRGIALLITLVIIALLAVYMTEFSFDTHLETRGIRNFQASFRARNAAKSLFKAALVGLQGGLNGEVREKVFFDQISPPLLRTASLLNPTKPEKIEGIQLLLPGLAESFPNVTFYTPYIRPIDHLFNLNRMNFSPGSPKDLDLFNEFLNLLSYYSNQQSVDSNQSQKSLNLGEESIRAFYASIYDWSDKNTDPDYPDSSIEGHVQMDDTEWEVKNTQFDKLSEIMLLQSKLIEDGYIDFQIPLNSAKPDVNSWDQNFTVYPVGNIKGKSTGDPKININLASQKNVSDFLKRYQSNNADKSTKQKYADSADLIAEVLIDDFDKQEYYKNFNQIFSKLEGDPLTSGLPKSEEDFFILWSNWYDIHLVTEIENVRAEVRAVVEVDRDENGKVKKENGEYAITIHDFQLH